MDVLKAVGARYFAPVRFSGLDEIGMPVEREAVGLEEGSGVTSSVPLMILSCSSE